MAEELVKVRLEGGPLHGQVRSVPRRPDSVAPTYPFSFEKDGELWAHVYAYDDNDPSVMNFVGTHHRTQ